MLKPSRDLSGRHCSQYLAIQSVTLEGLLLACELDMCAGTHLNSHRGGQAAGHDVERTSKSASLARQPAAYDFFGE